MPDVDALPADLVGPKEAKYLFDNLIGIVQFYSDILDPFTPNELIEKNLAQEVLSKYPLDASKESAQLLGEIHTDLLNAEDAYLNSKQKVYEICGSAKPFIKGYNNLFEGLNKAKATAQKTLLHSIANKAVTRLGTAVDQLLVTNSSLLTGASHLTSLNNRLSVEFDVNSKYFKDKIAVIANTGNKTIDEPLIKAFKLKLENTKTFFSFFNSEISETFRFFNESANILKEKLQYLDTLNKEIAVSTPYDSIPIDMVHAIQASSQKLLASCEAFSQKIS